MVWKLFIATAVPYGVAMALIAGLATGATAVTAALASSATVTAALARGLTAGALGAAGGLASGLVFGLLMAAALGGAHWMAGNTQVHAGSEFVFPASPEVAVQAARLALLQVKSRGITESGGTLSASMPVNWRCFGESISIEIMPRPEKGSLVRIRSSPRLRTTLVDYGKNQSNVNALTSAILGYPGTRGAA